MDQRHDWGMTGVVGALAREGIGEGGGSTGEA